MRTSADYDHFKVTSRHDWDVWNARKELMTDPRAVVLTRLRCFNGGLQISVVIYKGTTTMASSKERLNVKRVRLRHCGTNQCCFLPRRGYSTYVLRDIRHRRASWASRQTGKSIFVLSDRPRIIGRPHCYHVSFGSRFLTHGWNTALNQTWKRSAALLRQLNLRFTPRLHDYDDRLIL